MDLQNMTKEKPTIGIFRNKMKTPSHLLSEVNQERMLLFLCGSGLFLFHGLRDFLDVPIVYRSFEDDYASNSNTSYLPLSGLSISSCHLGIMVGQLVIPSIIGKFSLNMHLRGSLFLTGVFAMLVVPSASHVWSLVIVRALQGIAQSGIYVITYAVLQEHKIEKFSVIYTFIFYMPWLGSALGLAIGCTPFPKTAAYLLGSLSIIMSSGTFLLSLETKFEMGTKSAWMETLKSKGTICTVVFHAGSSLALHTFLIGLPCTMMLVEESHGPINWSFFVVLIVLVTGIFTQLFGLLRVWFITSSLLSVLKRRKLLTLGGVIVTMSCLCMAGTLGKQSVIGLIIPCVGGAAIGGSISISASRMCLHDLAPCFPIPIMHMGNIAASIGAAVASGMFIGISKGIGNVNNHSTVAWTVPALIELILIIQLMVFLSVDTLPHQFINVPEIRMDIPAISFTMDPSGQSKSADDSKSFKSIRSAWTFKSIASSYANNPAASFISMPEKETDTSTVWHSESGICHSITQERDSELRSIKADSSYKSIMDLSPQQLCVSKNVNKQTVDLNRTSEWLNAYHMPSNGGPAQGSNHDERQKAQRNMLLALQW